MARSSGGYPNPQHFEVADRFSTEDAVASANNSPASTTGGSVLTLSAPYGAIAIVINPSVDLYFSEDLTHATYTMIKANVPTRIELAGMDAVYVKQSAGGTDVYYHWELVY